LVLLLNVLATALLPLRVWYSQKIRAKLSLTGLLLLFNRPLYGNAAPSYRPE
jgi:hypothetical protein